LWSASSERGGWLDVSFEAPCEPRLLNVTKVHSCRVLVVMSTLRFIPVTAVMLFGAACQNSPMPPVGYCTAPRSIAVLVTALDSTTRASVADGAHGVVQSGTYVDSLRLSFGVLEGGTKLGTYEVTVERPGYRQWIRTNVQVTGQGPCGNVIPVDLTALLQSSL